MFADVAEILSRARHGVIGDVVGVVSLFVLLFAGLGFSGTL
jgi:hypothetical protein